jgi:O-antigen ligase
VRAAIRRIATVSFVAILLAVLFPFPITKVVVVALLAIPLAAELYERPQVALAAIALFLPVVDLLPPIPIPGLNAQTFVSLAAILGTASLRSKTPERVPYAGMFWVLAVFTILEIAQTLLTTNLVAKEVLTQSKNWIGYLPLFFYSARAAREGWARRLIVAAVAASAAMCALNSVATFVLKGGGERLRSGGLVGNQPNIYGGYLAMVLPLLVALVLNGTGGKMSRLMATAGASLGFFALIFTKSRGAWLAFAAALIAMIVLKRQAKLLALCLIFALFAGTLMPSAFWTRLDDTWEDESAQRTETGLDASTQSRITQWEAFPTMFWDSPVLGHGLWTFPWVIFEFGLYDRPISPHSSILRFGVEFGVFGLILYFILMLRLIVGAVRTSRVAVTVFDRSMTVGLVGCFSALLIADTSGARFFNDEIFAVFCILAGVVSGAMVAVDKVSPGLVPARLKRPRHAKPESRFTRPTGPASRK